MPSVFTHALFAVGAGKICFSSGMPKRFWWLSVCCSLLPDIDVVGFAFGISYGDLWGHRGFTHSLLFAFGLSLFVVPAGFSGPLWRKQRPWLVLYFFVVTASHGALDAMTNGGLGVAFFAPLDNRRYFFPWTPVAVSPIGIVPFFSRYGVEVLISEIAWIWVPMSIVAALAAVLWRRRRLRTGSVPRR